MFTELEKKFLTEELLMLDEWWIMEFLDKDYKNWDNNKELYSKAVDFRDWMIKKLWKYIKPYSKDRKSG